MKSGSESIQRLLATLAKHADLVAEAFDGPITGGDRQREAGIAALVATNALRPYEEGSYYLSTHLHDHFSAVLVSFNAFQALTRIANYVYQAREQWAELCRLKEAGATKDMQRLDAALERSVIEIGDIVERNIRLLNSMVLAQYGNVDNLNSKLRQNRFYAREVSRCLRELEQVDAFVQSVSDGSIAAGLPRMRQLVTRRLSVQLLPWTARLKDAQAVISRRLFEARLMEHRLKQLARYAAWLSSNRTSDGWEVEVPEDANPALFPPEVLPQRPQPDTTDADSANAERLLTAVARMTERRTDPFAKPVNDEASLVISDEMESIVLRLAAHEEALQHLVDQLRMGDGFISLRAWRNSSPELADVEVEHWLLYASIQLRSGEFEMSFVGDAPLEPLPINETFYDVEVRAKAPELA